MILTFSVNDELYQAVTSLSEQLGISRPAVCRCLLGGCLQNAAQIEQWKEAVLGPQFDFMRPVGHHPRKKRGPRAKAADDAPALVV